MFTQGSKIVFSFDLLLDTDLLLHLVMNELVSGHVKFIILHWYMLEM